MPRLLMLALAAALAGCDSPVSTACTMEYLLYDVGVRDAQGAPVTDAEVDVRRASNGASLRCTSDDQGGCVPLDASMKPEGRYSIMSDGIDVARAGERFTVVATRGTQRAETDFRFRSDGCHVRKLSGPDVLMLR